MSHFIPFKKTLFTLIYFGYYNKNTCLAFQTFNIYILYKEFKDSAYLERIIRLFSMTIYTITGLTLCCYMSRFKKVETNASRFQFLRTLCWYCFNLGLALNMAWPEISVITKYEVFIGLEYELVFSGRLVS